MGLAILVLGFSGSGKSASLRNFKEDELALVNVNGKQLPFRTQFKSTIHTDNYGEIERFMKAQTAKSIAVDDSQYLMVNEFMRRAKETGYQKFTDIAKNFWELVRSVEMLPEDVIVYFLNHLDTGEDGRQKAKTIGKLLDEKITRVCSQLCLKLLWLTASIFSPLRRTALTPAKVLSGCLTVCT